jgi:hypothetical protein
MPTDHLHIADAAHLAHGDLVEIDRQLTERRELDAQWLLLVKLSLVSVAKVTDLELSVRSIYKEHPEVPEEFKRWKSQFEFAKYIRNVLVGHTHGPLIEGYRMETRDTPIHLAVLCLAPAAAPEAQRCILRSSPESRLTHRPGG